MGSVEECLEAQEVECKRPLAHFPPDIWGENFVCFTPQDLLMMENYEQEMEAVKEEVRKMLLENGSDLEKKMKLIDAVERLGVYYFYENEINESISQIFEELRRNDFDIDYDLRTTASYFRIFRQHGYKLPCDVLKKFTDNEGGKMKESLKSDIKGMVSLYEACHLRLNGEPILDEALTFTTHFLESVATMSDQARHALHQVSHFGIQRVESRHYISFYEDDEHRNEALLKLAKLEFNRWWHKFDFKTKLSYARQRCVECHFWATAMYFEPQYSEARMLLVRVLLVISILDDTYDAFATFEEIQLLTEAFQRWDLSAMNQLPKEYMKLVFQFVYDNYEHFAKEMTKKGKPYAAEYAKNRVLDLIRSYYTEAKWLKAKYVPTFEEYMVNARITGVAQILSTSSIMGMDEIVDEKPFQIIPRAPKAIRACEVIGIMDDIVSHEEEQARGHVASGVECYMKDHNMSREQVVKIFNKMIEDAWKELNEEFLIKANPTEDDLPRPVLKRILNLARVVDALYKVIDGYTYSEKLIKEDIITTYLRPIVV
ncbi:valerianol synthase TPS8-like isoform X2 [Silene latifolia]|uniref:valerianol synthase TPS8-like isoform X2 n=1 Tax=Silene latifolia TaxID=37657 RepID=UPI003D78568C